MWSSVHLLTHEVRRKLHVAVCEFIYVVIWCVIGWLTDCEFDLCLCCENTVQ